MGGGPDGSIGALWSWVVGVVACVGDRRRSLFARRQRKRFNFPLRPVWAEATLAVLGCGADPRRRLRSPMPIPGRSASPSNYAEANDITVPEGGLFISHGIAIPVLIAVGVGVVMTFVATRTRFGRYVFAIGGNPEAAELAGINTRWVTVKIFMLMGALVRHRRGDLDGAPQRRDQRPGHARRAATSSPRR